MGCWTWKNMSFSPTLDRKYFMEINKEKQVKVVFSLQKRLQLAAWPDLFRQQFFAERVQSDELSGQSSRVNEPFSHQHDFTDQFKVRNHHSTWPEKNKNIQTKRYDFTSDQKFFQREVCKTYEIHSEEFWFGSLTGTEPWDFQAAQFCRRIQDSWW